MNLNELLISHQIPAGSNKVFSGIVNNLNNESTEVIYKPQAGEKPLIDFLQGTLYIREFVSYLISQALGWPNIPETIIRKGPYGIGSVQRLIKYKNQENYFSLLNNFPNELIKIAVFDLVVNNADRKGGHFILDCNNILWSIDHGLTFHHIFKVRTVIFDFEGEKIPKILLNDLSNLLEQLTNGECLINKINPLITNSEFVALKNRINFLINNPYIPHLNPFYNVPTPLI